MVEKYLNRRFLILYVLPILLGSLTTLSFQPFNFTIINFFIFPCLFFILCNVNKRSKNKYRKKPHLINLFFVGYFFWNWVLFNWNLLDFKFFTI